MAVVGCVGRIYTELKAAAKKIRKVIDKEGDCLAAPSGHRAGDRAEFPPTTAAHATQW